MIPTTLTHRSIETQALAWSRMFGITTLLSFLIYHKNKNKRSLITAQRTNMKNRKYQAIFISTLKFIFFSVTCVNHSQRNHKCDVFTRTLRLNTERSMLSAFPQTRLLQFLNIQAMYKAQESGSRHYHSC